MSTYKTLLIFFVIQLISLNTSAESLNLKFDRQYAYQVSNAIDITSPLADSNDRFEIDTNKSDKSILPVVLSATFLMMSLYGDNPDSPMYRAIGATATVISLRWYMD